MLEKRIQELLAQLRDAHTLELSMTIAVLEAELARYYEARENLRKAEATDAKVMTDGCKK